MSQYSTIVQKIALKIKIKMGMLDKIHAKNNFDVDNYSQLESERCALIIKQINSHKKQMVEYLRADNEELLKKSNGLLKQSKKMLKEGNHSGAKLIFNRVEEIASKRQQLNKTIIGLTTE
jgi:hypothetical protein